MMGSLEEAAIFLETAVLNLEILSLMPEFQAIEVKNHSIYTEGLLRMQLWALFSQLHRHREALYHAQISVRISHFLIRDILEYIECSKLQELSYANQKSNYKDLQNTSLTKIKIPATDVFTHDRKESSKMNEEGNHEK